MGWISARSLVVFGMATLLIYGTSASVAQAKGSRPLVQSDFYNAVNVSMGSDSSSNLRLDFGESDARVSFDTSRYSGYNAVTFDVDNSNGPADAGNGIRVLGDGKTLVTIDFGNPATARHQTVRFAGRRVITFVRHSASSSGDYYVSTPMLVVSGASPVPAPTIVLASAIVHAGGQQTVDVSTTPGRQVTIVIVYANGEHQIFGPQQSGPTGHDIYTFSVPHGSKGTAEVVVIVRGLSVAQTTFAVS